MITLLMSVTGFAQSDPDFRGTWVPKLSKHIFRDQVAYTDTVKLLPSATLLVGDTIADHADKAVIEVESTTKGVLLPRMTAVQRAAISTPPTGLMVFDTDSAKLCWYTGSLWKCAQTPADP